jgi:hypothetical protein
MKPSLDFTAFLVAAVTATTLARTPSALAQAPAEATSSPGVASGSVDDNDEARRLYRNGVAAFDADKPQEARQLLLRAWSIRRTYDVASVLGQVELALNLPRDAAEHLDFAIRNFPPQLSADALQRVRDTFSQAEKRVGTLLVRVDRAGTKILVDAKVVGTSPLSSPLFLEPGAHTVEAEEGSARASRTVAVEAGATQSLGLDLGRSTPLPAQQTSRDGSSTRTVALIGGGTIVLVGAALGVGFSLSAASDRDRGDTLRASLANGACSPSQPPSASCSALLRASEAHDRDRNIATASFAVAGAALVATAAYLFLTGTDAPHEATAAPGVRLGATATKDQGALWLSGAF